MEMAIMDKQAQESTQVNEVFKYTPAVLSEGFDIGRVDPTKYKFISTKEIVEALEENGFKPTRAVQANTRMAHRRSFVKHLLAFEMPEVAGLNIPEGMKPQVMLLNSHDGTTSYQLFLGLFNDLTATSMVVGTNTFDVQRVMHKGNKSLDEIIYKSKVCIDGFQEVLATVVKAQDIILTAEQQKEFAEQAIFARYEELKVSAEEVLKPLHEGDTGQDLWSVFNRVRTWVIDPAYVRTGFSLRPVNVKGRKITAIRNISKNVTINRMIWDLMYLYM